MLTFVYKIWKFLTMIHKCNYFIFANYPSPCFYAEHDVSETGVRLCLQVKPIQLRPIEEASLYLFYPKTERESSLRNVVL
jgi:hypothetical protein